MHTIVSSIATAALLVLYVLPNFRLSEGQVEALLWSVVVLIGTVSPAAFIAYRRISRPVSRWIDQHNAGGLISEEVRDAAFRSILQLPVQITLASLSMWILCGAGICIGQLWFEENSRFSIGVMFAALLGTACVTQVFGYVKLRRDVRLVREILAEQIADPIRRAELAPSFSISSRLTSATVSLVGAAVVMSVGMSQVQAARSAAGLIARVQTDCITQILSRIEKGQPVEEAISEVRAFYAATVESVRVVELTQDIASVGLEGILLQAEWEVVLAGAGSAGSSLGVDTPHAFAWAPLPGIADQVLVVSASDARLMPMAWTTQALFFGWVAIATILAIAVGRLVGAELGETTARLQEQARRIAGGDLRVRVTVESEDELGDLARSLDVMGSALRTTLGAAAEAADELESASAEMAESAEQVATGAQAQQTRLADASERLDRIQEKSGEISASATEVRLAMDESASSSVELQASASQLRETAGALTQQVEASSQSLQSSGESLGQTARSPEALRSVADELTSSVEALAESARSVGGEAEDTSGLSTRVHEIAEKGRAQVRGTTRGMQTIRESTSLAVESVRKLEKRTQHIDNVVSVIGEVADETRLLGLNAAIIAAQAGESGGGFAIVASQIRQLAGRVQVHTGEVSELIEGIRQETHHLVEAVENNALRVDEGMELSAQSGELLDDITEAARQSGERMSRIVEEVQMQARTTTSTATEMETLRSDVERIGAATREQEQNADVLVQSHSKSEEASVQMRRTSEEQALAVERISGEVEQVRSAMGEIDSALSQQADACRTGAEALRDVATHSEEGERTAKTMSEAMRGLLRRAEALRERMRQFQL